MTKNRAKVAVGLSGGVDSSVAAALLKERGYDVVGITMAIFDPSGSRIRSERQACYGPCEKEDVEAAAAVCRKLNIPFHVIDLKRAFREHVIDYFRSEYLGGRTPNPCVVCNDRLKFGFLLHKAQEAGVDFDLFATGHYARVIESGGRFLLKKAADPAKDQTYFLYTLRPEQLSQTLFPLGEFTKEQVREMARSFGLETAERPESQDFIAGGDYASLFNGEEIRAGDIVDEEGRILGRHRGIIHYTVGQRRGLGIASQQPLYVMKIDAANNRIVVSGRENILSKGLIATDVNLIAVDTLEKPYRVKAKIRLQHEGAHGTLFPWEKNKVKIIFDAPQMAVSPGQSAVLYTGDIVFGGGIIEKGAGLL